MIGKAVRYEITAADRERGVGRPASTSRRRGTVNGASRNAITYMEKARFPAWLTWEHHASPILSSCDSLFAPGNSPASVSSGRTRDTQRSLGLRPHLTSTGAELGMHGRQLPQIEGQPPRQAEALFAPWRGRGFALDSKGAPPGGARSHDEVIPGARPQPSEL